jgi:peptidoglycan/xylan/chitin deacetylase (PgdA/CDA1 family)
MDRFFQNAVPILMIHRISRSPIKNRNWISADHLRNCLDYLVDRDFTFVSLHDLIKAFNRNQKLPEKSVVFTIDDGYIDQAEIAAPIFIEYNCPATFFVITGMLDQLLWPWDAKVSWIIDESNKQALMSSATINKLNIKLARNFDNQTLRRAIQEALKKLDAKFIPEILQSLANDAGVTVPTNPPPDYQPMTWDMARTLEEQGIQFAPHSINHNILSKLEEASMELEVIESWKRVKFELDNPLKTFCYPNGKAIDFGNREIKFIKDNGFTGAVSANANLVKYKFDSKNYIYSLPRLPLPDNMTELAQYCSWLERARAVFI